MSKLFETKIVRNVPGQGQITISMEAPYESDKVAVAALINNLKAVIGCLQKKENLDVQVAEGERVFFHHKSLSPKQIESMNEAEVILA